MPLASRRPAVFKPILKESHVKAKNQRAYILNHK